MRVDRYNSFGVNRVGLNGPGFPLSIEVARCGDVWTVYGTALRAVDLAALLVEISAPVTLVFNLGQAAWFDDEGDLLGAASIAERLHVRTAVHDVTWASPAAASTASELLVMASVDLNRFFTGWSLYDVALLDLPARPAAAQVEEIVLSVNTWRNDDPPILSSVKAASTYYAGHDDCYFYVESRTDDLPRRILCRLLALLAGAALIDGDDSVEVAEPSEHVAADVLAISASWVGVASAEYEDHVAISLSPAAWRPLGQPIPHNPTHIAKFNRASGAWAVRPSD